MRTIFKILSFFMLMNISTQIITMQMDTEQKENTNKRRREENIEPVKHESINDILHTTLTTLIQYNSIFNPFDSMEAELSRYPQLIYHAKEVAKEVFTPNESMLTQQELNRKLKSILESQYTKEKEIEAAKLIIAGANPNIIINYNNNSSILNFINNTGKFSNLAGLLKIYGSLD